MVHDGEITLLIRRSSAGDREAFDALFQALYDELRRIAQGQRNRWEGVYTLSPTVLVHEAYLKLVRQEKIAWSDRAHFLAVAARAMRHILINYAERKNAAKRGGSAEEYGLDEANPLTEEAAAEVLALHDALERLDRVNPRQVRVVEARFFAGLSIEETAVLLGVSPATVKRDWLMASAWLYREIESGRS